MKAPLPRTLFARLMLIWVIGIAAVLATSLALFLGERDRFDRDVLFEGLAREIAAAVDVLERLEPAERGAWIEALGRRRLRFALQGPPPEARSLPERFPLVQALRRAQPDRDIRLYALPARGEWHGGRHERLLASLVLADGTPLAVRLPFPALPTAREPAPPGRIFAALAALIAGITLLAWLAVRVATRPLSRLAQAARALGEDPNRPPLETSGPTEVSLAANAFNQMQQRLQDYVGERTRILAAISHDLQTPITRLRLRAEEIEDEGLRARVQSDLDAMQALAREGLDYARSLDASAPLQPVDLEALVDSLCENAREMGWPVSRTGRLAAPVPAQLTALRRALWNLVENGVKFGQAVEITLREAKDEDRIEIRDHGPGLADADLERVFEPFYRTEYSRSRDTGGTGLGLAIARNLVRAQGGDVTLQNAPGGGLVAILTLPRRTVKG